MKDFFISYRRKDALDARKDGVVLVVARAPRSVPAALNGVADGLDVGMELCTPCLYWIPLAECLKGEIDKHRGGCQGRNHE